MSPLKPGGRPKLAWTASRNRKLIRLYLLTDVSTKEMPRLLGADGFHPSVRSIQVQLKDLLPDNVTVHRRYRPTKKDQIRNRWVQLKRSREAQVCKYYRREARYNVNIRVIPKDATSANGRNSYDNSAHHLRAQVSRDVPADGLPTSSSQQPINSGDYKGCTRMKSSLFQSNALSNIQTSIPFTESFSISKDSQAPYPETTSIFGGTPPKTQGLTKTGSEASSIRSRRSFRSFTSVKSFGSTLSSKFSNSVRHIESVLSSRASWSSSLVHAMSPRSNKIACASKPHLCSEEEYQGWDADETAFDAEQLETPYYEEISLKSRPCCSFFEGKLDDNLIICTTCGFSKLHQLARHSRNLEIFPGDSCLLDRFGNTPLHHAAAAGNTTRVLQLMTSASQAQARNTSGETFLHVFCMYTEDRSPSANFEVVRRAYNGGFDFSIRDHNGITAAYRLQQVFNFETNVELTAEAARMLHIGDKQLRNEPGIRDYRKGSLACILEKMLSHDEEPPLQDQIDATRLFGHETLEHPNSRPRPNSNHPTIKMPGAFSDGLSDYAMSNSSSCQERLLDLQTDQVRERRMRETPEFSLVQLVEAKKPTNDFRPRSRKNDDLDANGNSKLIACLTGWQRKPISSRQFEKLIKHCNIHLRDRRGYTALAIAVQHGLRDAVSLLLEHGANPNTRSYACTSVVAHASASLAQAQKRRDDGLYAKILSCLMLVVDHGGKSSITSYDEYAMPNAVTPTSKRDHGLSRSATTSKKFNASLGSIPEQKRTFENANRMAPGLDINMTRENSSQPRNIDIQHFGQSIVAQSVSYPFHIWNDRDNIGTGFSISPPLYENADGKGPLFNTPIPQGHTLLPESSGSLFPSSSTVTSMDETNRHLHQGLTVPGNVGNLDATLNLQAMWSNFAMRVSADNYFAANSAPISATHVPPNEYLETKAKQFPSTCVPVINMDTLKTDHQAREYYPRDYYTSFPIVEFPAANSTSGTIGAGTACSPEPYLEQSMATPTKTFQDTISPEIAKNSAMIPAFAFDGISETALEISPQLTTPPKKRKRVDYLNLQRSESFGSPPSRQYPMRGESNLRRAISDPENPSLVASRMTSARKVYGRCRRQNLTNKVSDNQTTLFLASNPFISVPSIGKSTKSPPFLYGDIKTVAKASEGIHGEHCHIDPKCWQQFGASSRYPESSSGSYRIQNFEDSANAWLDSPVTTSIGEQGSKNIEGIPHSSFAGHSRCLEIDKANEYTNLFAKPPNIAGQQSSAAMHNFYPAPSIPTQNTRLVSEHIGDSFLSTTVNPPFSSSDQIETTWDLFFPEAPLSTTQEVAVSEGFDAISWSTVSNASLPSIKYAGGLWQLPPLPNVPDACQVDFSPSSRIKEVLNEPVLFEIHQAPNGELEYGTECRILDPGPEVTMWQESVVDNLNDFPSFSESDNNGR